MTSPSTKGPAASRVAELYMWVIYERPSDFPDAWVVRKWRTGPGGRLEVALTCNTFDSLERARAEGVPAGTVRIHRGPNDDPVIVETWL